MAYCNVTTDLTDVFPDIGNYQEKETIPNARWTVSSGQTNTYEAHSVGQVNMVFENGAMLTLTTSIALVEATAARWWYDATVDKLYVHATGSGNLITTTTLIIQTGEDWDGFLDNMRDKASQWMDGYLNRVAPTPLMPRIVKTHDTADYPYPIVRICALLTCHLVLMRRDPMDARAQEFFKLVFNNMPGEEKGLINQILDGDLTIQDQISSREVGSFNVYPKSDNTTTAYIWFLGKYGGEQYEKWRVQIDTAGAPGTATWKVSYDTGTTWDLTLQKTFDASNNDRRIHISSGIYAIFEGTFGSGDYWDIEVFPQTDTADATKIFTAECPR